jgi:hypothetical protein
MNKDDVEDLAALSRRLGCTSRRALLAAARMVEQKDPDAHERLQATRRVGAQHDELADECANLLLSSPNSYALINLTSALRALWKVAP